MIYVSQAQLDQVNYLLAQSALGNHLLFDPRTVRRVAAAELPTRECSARTERAERLLEQMILRPTLESKKAFLEGLAPEEHDDVARVYFNIVHNSARETQGLHH